MEQYSLQKKISNPKSFPGSRFSCHDSCSEHGVKKPHCRVINADSRDCSTYIPFFSASGLHYKYSQMGMWTSYTSLRLRSYKLKHHLVLLLQRQQKPWAIMEAALPVIFIFSVDMIMFKTSNAPWMPKDQCWDRRKWSFRWQGWPSSRVWEELCGEAKGTAPSHHCVAPWPRWQWCKVLLLSSTLPAQVMPL